LVKCPWSLRQFAVAQIFQTRGRYSHTHKELAEQSIDGAYFVEAHLIDQLLEDQRVIRKQVHAPLPIVKAYRSRDDLLHRPRIAPAYQPVFFHLALPLFNGQAVPVLVLSASAVHGIEADVARSWNLRKQPRTHGFRLAFDGVLNRGIPLRRVWLNSLLSQGAKKLYRGLVQTQHANRQIRRRQLQ